MSTCLEVFSVVYRYDTISEPCVKDEGHDGFHESESYEWREK